MDLQGSGEYVPCLNFEQLVDIMELRARGPRKIQDVDGDSYIFGFPAQKRSETLRHSEVEISALSSFPSLGVEGLKLIVSWSARECNTLV